MSNGKTPIALRACLILALSSVAASAAGDLHVWALPGDRHVLRDAPPGAERSVELAAARNEWRSFQVLMRSDAAVGGIDLRPGEFGPAERPVAQVRLFRQHQLHVEKLSPRNTAAEPGWYPDPLIPFVDPVTGKPPVRAALRAVPFGLPANETHGFWVDVYVEPGAAAGRYEARFEVLAAGREPIPVTVRLTVWDFDLPDVPTMQTALGSPAARMEGQHRQPVAAVKEAWAKLRSDLYAQCARLCADHRINASPPGELLWPMPQADGSRRIPPERLAELIRFIKSYHVNALCVPNVSNNACKDPDAERAKLAAWLKAYDVAAEEIRRQVGRDVTFFAYLIDEPNDAKAYEFTRTWGKAIRECKSAVKVMVTEQPQPQDAAWGDLYGAVDIWCPLMALFQAEPAAARQKLGETIWTYTALTQGKEPSPWWLIDYPLLDYRVSSWIAWRYRIRGLLYWGGMVHWNEVADPWTDPGTYGRKTGGRAIWNGEGTLVYPARGLGYEGIAPSIRLKALRDGIEDYEYLAILERAGLAAEAERIVLPLAGSWFQWNPDPSAYDAARARLAERIVQAKASTKQ